MLSDGDPRAARRSGKPGALWSTWLHRSCRVADIVPWLGRAVFFCTSEASFVGEVRLRRFLGATLDRTATLETNWWNGVHESPFVFLAALFRELGLCSVCVERFAPCRVSF